MRIGSTNANAQNRGPSMEDFLGGANRVPKRAGGKHAGRSGAGFSGAGMRAMLSADTSMKQAVVQGNVRTNPEGKAGIPESEIKMDKGRGSDTEKKEKEPAAVEQRADDAAASQINTLADANKEIKEAAKAEQEQEEEETTEKTVAKKGRKIGKGRTLSPNAVSGNTVPKGGAEQAAPSVKTGGALPGDFVPSKESEQAAPSVKTGGALPGDFVPSKESEQAAPSVETGGALPKDFVPSKRTGTVDGSFVHVDVRL